MKTAPNPTLTYPDENESIDAIEQQDLAGLDPKKPLQLDGQKLDSEIPLPLPIEEKGSFRTITVAIMVGSVFIGAIGVWLMLKPKHPKTIANPTFETQKKKATAETEPDYRAKLALQNQTYDLQKQNKPQPQPQLQPQPATKNTVKPAPKIIRVRQTPPPPSKPRTTTKPNYVVRSIPQPLPPAPQPLPPAPPPKQIKPPTPSTTIDPYQQWTALANLGQTTGNIPLNNSNNPVSNQTTNQKPRLKQTIPNPNETINPTNNTIPVVSLTLNNQQNDNTNDYTNGEQGILNRQITDSQPTKNTQTIPFGTRTKGIISTPLIWDTSNNDPNGQLYRRFAITLTEDFPDSQNQTAIKAGTVLIIEATTINPQNYLVTANAIALITKDEYGQIKQYPIPPGTIVIQGADYQPLIAQSVRANNGDIIKQDILVGSLSALGRIGSVLTQPESTTTINGNFGTTTTVTNNNDPQIWQAALDGFFTPVANRISQRSEQQISQMLKNPNIAILPVNTQVEVVINGFLSIN